MNTFRTIVATLLVSGATWIAVRAAYADQRANPVRPPVPTWAADAIFYQIFPERFHNGDASNDPTRDGLEFPGNVSDKWSVTPWTKDWYSRAEWERERGANFYDDGVFDRRYGGDLQGVLDKLDYLEHLGINAIYFNPVFYAKSLHKYDGNTYHHVDPYFGPDPEGDLKLMEAETSDPGTWNWTAADKLFLDLVAQAHERGIRVIVDGVFNHTGRDFFAFKNLVEQQADSPYKDWYIVQSFDDPNTPGDEFKYKGWWGVMTLPEFADNASADNLHPGPKAYIFDATRRWMDPDGDGDPSDGIDGWRLDVAAEVPTGFWAEWNSLVREVNPEAYTVAEHWHDAAEFLADGGFSATMNYHGFAWPVKGYLIDGTMTPSDAAQTLEQRMLEYPESMRYALQNLIDSHDTERVASMIVNADPRRPYLQPERYDYDVNDRVSPRHWDGYKIRQPNSRERRIQRMVGVMQATFVGAPMYYYGTEAGMWGGDDPCDRMPMIWPDLTYDDQTNDPEGRPLQAKPVRFDHGLHGFYRALNFLRKSHPALRGGGFRVIATDDSAKGLVFTRSDAGETLWVVFNRGDRPWTVEMEAPKDGEPGLVNEVFTASGNSGAIKLVQHNGDINVTIPALDAVVLHRQRAGLAADH